MVLRLAGLLNFILIVSCPINIQERENVTWGILLTKKQTNKQQQTTKTTTKDFLTLFCAQPLVWNWSYCLMTVVGVSSSMFRKFLLCHLLEVSNRWWESEEEMCNWFVPQKPKKIFSYVNVKGYFISEENKVLSGSARILLLMWTLWKVESVFVTYDWVMGDVFFFLGTVIQTTPTWIVFWESWQTRAWLKKTSLQSRRPSYKTLLHIISTATWISVASSARSPLSEQT